MDKMKLIEAMKELKLIVAKISRNREETIKYSSGLSNEKPVFETEKAQSEYVARLIQSTEDLVKRYLDLKSAIEYTNLKTKVTIHGETRSISEWLVYKRNLAGIRHHAYQAANDSVALGRKSKDAAALKDVQIVRYYDEAVMNAKLRNLIEILGSLDGTLEVINATTELMSVPV